MIKVNKSSNNLKYNKINKNIIIIISSLYILLLIIVLVIKTKLKLKLNKDSITNLGDNTQLEINKIFEMPFYEIPVSNIDNEYASIDYDNMSSL